MWAILGRKGSNHGLLDASGQLGSFILIYNDFPKLWVCRYVLRTPLQKFNKTLTGWMVDGTLQHFFFFCPELDPSITADRPAWIPAWGPDSLPDKEPS